MRTLAFSITEYQTGIICEYQVVCFIDLCTRPYSALYAPLSLIQFTFWSCISSSTVRFVTITSSASVRSFCILTSQTFYPPKVFAVIRAKSASQSRVLHKHLSQVSSRLSLPPTMPRLNVHFGLWRRRLSEGTHVFLSSLCGRLQSLRYVLVGLARLAISVLLHVNEIIQGCRAYLWQAPAFSRPYKHIPACTNVLGAANWEAPPESVCRMLLVSFSSSLETSVAFYSPNKVFVGFFFKKESFYCICISWNAVFHFGFFIPLVLLSICIHISCMFLTSESFLKQCVWLEMATTGPVFESEHSKQRDDQPGSHKCHPQCCDRLDWKPKWIATQERRRRRRRSGNHSHKLHRSKRNTNSMNNCLG